MAELQAMLSGKLNLTNKHFLNQKQLSFPLEHTEILVLKNDF